LNCDIVAEYRAAQTAMEQVRFELDIYGLTDNNTSDASGNSTKALIHFKVNVCTKDGSPDTSADAS
jgi:hypothetical protein